LKNHFIFKKFAWIPLKIKNSFTFGLGNLISLTIFFGIYIFMFTTGQLKNLSAPTIDGITLLFQSFSTVVTIIFASALLTIFFREIILLVTQRRILLYYFTPITNEWWKGTKQTIPYPVFLKQMSTVLRSWASFSVLF